MCETRCLILLRLSSPGFHPDLRMQSKRKKQEEDLRVYSEIPKREHKEKAKK